LKNVLYKSCRILSIALNNNIMILGGVPPSDQVKVTLNLKNSNLQPIKHFSRKCIFYEIFKHC